MNQDFKTILIIPCFNEEKRLDMDAIERFLKAEDNIKIIFVNDGSTDNTESILSDFEQKNKEQILILNLEKNSGKAEAVRRGMLLALKENCDYIGYWDADLATPFSELKYFFYIFEQNEKVLLATGARIAKLGSSIERSFIRHYSGRIIATIIAKILEVQVYDTQCGAKLFRNTDKLKTIFQDKFLTDWLFDVEIFIRINNEGYNLHDVVYEFPLNKWKDIGESKVKWYHIVKVIKDLFILKRLSKFQRSK